VAVTTSASSRTQPCRWPEVVAGGFADVRGTLVAVHFRD